MARPKALAALPDDPPPSSTDPVAPPADLHELQAAVEGVPAGNTVDMLGESYRIGDRIGLMPLLRFAHAARRGIAADDMEGMAAMYDILGDCIHADDWDRFQSDATTKKADADEILKVVQQAIELIAARPTQPPSDSSDGRSTTSPNSTGSSSSPDAEPGRATEKVYRIEDLIAKAQG